MAALLSLYMVENMATLLKYGSSVNKCGQKNKGSSPLQV